MTNIFRIYTFVIQPQIILSCLLYLQVDAKYDPAVAAECMDWIRQYTPNSDLDKPLQPHGNSADEVHKDIGDGYVLCV